VTGGLRRCSVLDLLASHIGGRWLPDRNLLGPKAATDVLNVSVGVSTNSPWPSASRLTPSTRRLALRCVEGHQEAVRVLPNDDIPLPAKLAGDLLDARSDGEELLALTRRDERNVVRARQPGDELSELTATLLSGELGGT